MLSYLGTPPGRVPPQAGYPLAGYPSAGYPLAGYPPSRVPPQLDLAGYPRPRLPHGILGNVAKHYGIRVPPLWTDRQTHVKTLPSRRTTYAGGNNTNVLICSMCSLLLGNLPHRTTCPVGDTFHSIPAPFKKDNHKRTSQEGGPPSWLGQV